MRLRVGLVGIGKIARDQHIPALRANPRFELVACASRNATVDGVTNFPDLGRHAGGSRTWTASPSARRRRRISTPALTALRAGKHVMLEKPPTATTRQIALLADEARAPRAARCSRPGTRASPPASMRRATGCARASSRRGRITWKEDVHHWHPGQRWIFEPGGFGVFDPGINALSVLTEILPKDVCVEARAARISARTSRRRSRRNLACAPTTASSIAAEFDFRQKGEQSWDIELDDHDGRTEALARRRGARDRRQDAGESTPGWRANIRGCTSVSPRCAQAGKSEVDWRPFQLVADAFLIGERRIVAPHQI